MALKMDKVFQKLILDISNNLTGDDLDQLKFLCMNEIQAAEMEAIKKPLHLLMALVKSGYIREDDTRYLDELLAAISAERLKTEVTKYHESKLATQPAQTPSVQHKGLPCKVRNLTGREKHVEDIVKHLTGPAPGLSVIIAAPGYGKSALATEIGHVMNEREHFSVLYVSVRELDSLESLAKEILKCVGVNPGNKPVCQAQHTLMSLEKETVLILDNAEDLQIREDEGKKLKRFIEYLCNNAHHLRMLVTTRKAIDLLDFEYPDVKLEPLSQISSAKLLTVLVAQEGKPAAVYEDLGAACGGIPLYLRIVASFIRNGYDPSVLLEKLKNNPIAVLKMKNPDSEEYRRRLLKFLRDCLDRDMLSALIRVSVFPKAFSAKDATVMFKDQENYHTFLSRLVGHALLHISEGSYSLHPFIQSLCRKDVEAIGLKEDANNAEHLFNSHYTEMLDKTRQEFLQFNACKSAIDKFNINRLNIFQAVYSCLKPEQSEHSNKKCLSVCIAATDFLAKIITSDEFHKLFSYCSDTACRINDLKRRSDCLTSLGFRHIIDSAHLKLNPGALQTLEQAYTIQMEELSPKERECEGHAHCKSKLGLCYVMQGEELEDEVKVKQGVEFVEEALKLRESLGDPVPLAAGYGELANTMRLRKMFKEAIDTWSEETLERYQQVLGKHPFTASTLNWIGICYLKLKMFEWAANYKEKALHMREELLGSHHQDVLRSTFELAQIQVEQGQLQKALDKLKVVASQQDKLLGCHPHTVETYKELGLLQEKLGNEELARNMRRKAEEYSCSIKERQVEYQRLSSDPPDQPAD